MALKKQIEDFKRTLARLKESYRLAGENRSSQYYEFFRDSAIQRFEFTVEIMWKALKGYLEEMEGITCRSPKSCIRDFFSAGYLTEDEARDLLLMIDDKNRTVHTYHEEVAEDIFKRLGLYISLFDRVFNGMEENLSL